VTQDNRMSGSSGRPLLESLIAELRHQRSVRQVAAASGYRVVTLGCAPA
jgi:hypothetical protein